MKISDFSLIGRLLIWSVISLIYVVTLILLCCYMWSGTKKIVMKHMDYRGGNNEVSL